MSELLPQKRKSRSSLNSCVSLKTVCDPHLIRRLEPRRGEKRAHELLDALGCLVEQEVTDAAEQLQPRAADFRLMQSGSLRTAAPVRLPDIRVATSGSDPVLNDPRQRTVIRLTVPSVTESDQQGPVEVVSRFWAAINSQDLDGLIEVCDQEMELHSVVGSVYRGHEGLKAWWHELHEALGTYEGTIGDSLTLGGLVLALVRVNASGQTSGMSDTRQVLQVFSIREGRVSRLAAYFEAGDALEDAARQMR